MPSHQLRESCVLQGWVEQSVVEWTSVLVKEWVVFLDALARRRYQLHESRVLRFLQATHYTTLHHRHKLFVAQLSII